MSRPKPEIIASYRDAGRQIDVCRCQAVYAVFYQGQPVKVRSHGINDGYSGYKYGKSSFPEPGHAINLAQRLNQAFGTEDYTVVELRSGRRVL